MMLHALKGLMRPTVWVTAEVIFSEAFSLALFAVQARLLGPTVFGLVAVVMVLVSFWDAVLHMAVIEALVSVRRIEDRHYATAAAGMVLVGLIFAAVVFACAKPVAALFRNEELASVMRAMAVLPVFAAFSVVPLAAARREIRFQTTTIRTIISLIAGGVVGLVLALMGEGVWALVWQALVQRLVAVIFIWSAVRPSFHLAISLRHACDLVTFARPLLISGIMSWGSGQLPRLFLGVYLGPTELGLFTTAGRFNAMVKQIALTPKAFVARVDLIRFVNDRTAFAKAARRMFLQIALFGFPICFGGAAIVPTLFHVWLDSRWYEAILPTQIMLLACLPYVTFYGSTAVFYSLNLQSSEAVVSTVLSLSIMAGMAVSVRFGLVATTIAVAVIPLALMPIPILAIRGKGHLAVGDILLPQTLPLIAAAVMGGAVTLARLCIAPFLPEAAALPLLIAGGAVLYPILIIALMPRPMMEFLRRFR
jgi:O-antigen/teichoic acid export membrane protein